VQDRATSGYETSTPGRTQSYRKCARELAADRSHIVRSACSRRCRWRSQSVSCHARTADPVKDRDEHEDAELKEKTRGGGSA